MAKKRTIVGSPLTPSVLSELGGVKEFPPTPTGFTPDGNWVNGYRIWTCHGYRETGNQDVGFLRLERTAGEGGEFTLLIHQQVVQTDGKVSVVSGDVRCRNDCLASPIRWELLSRGAYPTRRGEKDTPLHCFVQLGQGVLPCEYWLDPGHRLLAVISMNKAYILDDKAEKT